MLVWTHRVHLNRTNCNLITCPQIVILSLCVLFEVFQRNSIVTIKSQTNVWSHYVSFFLLLLSSLFICLFLDKHWSKVTFMYHHCDTPNAPHLLGFCPGSANRKNKTWMKVDKKNNKKLKHEEEYELSMNLTLLLRQGFSSGLQIQDTSAIWKNCVLIKMVLLTWIKANLPTAGVVFLS